MNKTAITKHEIYNKLRDFSERDLNEIHRYIDFLMYKNNTVEKKSIKLEGILKGFALDFSDLETFRKSTWEHIDQEWSNE